MSKLPFHIAKFNTPQGNRGIFYIFPFSGDTADGKHHYNNHSHARNFVKYMFSQSKAHPQNALTINNFFLDFGDGSGTPRDGYVENPKALLDDFLKRSFPKQSADRHLVDDGCYPLFIQQLKGESIVSNFVSGKDGKLYFRSDLAKVLRKYITQFDLDWGKEVDDMKKFVRGATVQSFASLKNGNERKRNEALIHKVSSKVLGNTEKVLLTVSHRDQPEHNPTYHIHRLVRTSDETPAPGM